MTLHCVFKSLHKLPLLSFPSKTLGLGWYCALSGQIGDLLAKLNVSIIYNSHLCIYFQMRLDCLSVHISKHKQITLSTQLLNTFWTVNIKQNFHLCEKELLWSQVYFYCAEKEHSHILRSWQKKKLIWYLALLLCISCRRSYKIIFLNLGCFCFFVALLPCVYFSINNIL